MTECYNLIGLSGGAVLDLVVLLVELNVEGRKFGSCQEIKTGISPNLGLK